MVFYHANCIDGFGAAFAAFEKFREGEVSSCDFIAAAYGDDPPECDSRDVYLLDFSYKRHELKKYVMPQKASLLSTIMLLLKTTCRGWIKNMII